MPRFEWRPDNAIRNLDLRVLLRRRATLTFDHTDADNKVSAAEYQHRHAMDLHKQDPKKNPHPGKYVAPTGIKATSQYVRAEFNAPWEKRRTWKGRTWTPKHSMSDWVNMVQPKGTKLVGTIVDAWFIEAMNGGRSDDRMYRTYKQYYNTGRKERVAARRSGGLMAQLTGGGGNPDEADLGVRIKLTGSDTELKFEWRLYEASAPEEWYSELYGHNVMFRCADGFYPDAAAAIEVFQKKECDDMFGRRYFPVISIEENHPDGDNLRGVANYAKSCSEPIVAHGRIFIGLRCKPDEFAHCIEECYKLGGKVPVGATWDWA
jgi:hypothetical protein